MDRDLIEILKDFRDRILTTYYVNSFEYNDEFRRRVEDILNQIDNILYDYKRY